MSIDGSKLAKAIQHAIDEAKLAYAFRAGNAMIKWFKVSYPAQAREVEGRAQDQGGDRRIVLWGELLEPPF